MLNPKIDGVSYFDRRFACARIRDAHAHIYANWSCTRFLHKFGSLANRPYLNRHGTLQATDQRVVAN
jgi:hypothetical protein